MPEKFTFEFIFEYFKSQNCELLSTKYINNRTKLNYICICGNEASINFDNFKSGSRCKNCKPSSIRIKHTLESVSNYFKEQNCVLISEKYINNKIKLEYICICGNKASINFDNFKRGNRCGSCKTFSLKQVEEYFKERGCKLLSKEYKNTKSIVEYICNCGNKSSIRFGHFKDGSRCMKCGGNERLEYEYIFNYFKEQNCKLLSTEYINNYSNIRYICNCGNESTITFKHFKEGSRCRDCGFDKASRKTYNYKEFTFPSGKTRKVQGYEHFILKELLKTYSEEQILTDRRDVQKLNIIINKNDATIQISTFHI
jgi:hypothetical protein